MANTESRIVATYTDDFGNTYENVPYKVERQEKLPLSDPLGPGPRSICGTRKYFSLRKAKVIFNDGFSIEVPIPSLDDVASVITALKANAEVACVGLIGEHWKVIPPGILGLSYATTGLEGVNKPPSTKFTYNYELDGSAAKIVRTVSIEALPTLLLTAQSACLDSVITQASVACAVSAGFSPRRFKGVRLNTATNGQFARQIVVSSSNPETIKTCAETVATNFNCLGYKGQSMANAFEWYN